MALQHFDVGAVDRPVVQACKLGDHRRRGAAAHFLEQRDGNHQNTPFAGTAGTKIAMTMPSLRQTVNDRAAASKIMESAVATAAPQRPNAGMSRIERPTLMMSVSA